MLASKLVEELNIKIEKHWDEIINVNFSKWFWDYERKEIIWTSHLWEEWIFINI